MTVGFISARITLLLKQIFLFYMGCFFASGIYAQEDGTIPAQFVSLKDVAPSIIVEMRYAGNDNFTGRPLPGYEANKCLLLKPAALDLGKVQDELLQKGMSLKMYDCYRPQRAVSEFIRWAQDVNDTLMKLSFYPNESKETLISKGYIAARSGHSRGDSVDLTIVKFPAKKSPPFDVNSQVNCAAPYDKRYADNSIDMGTGYDCFDSLAHTENKKAGKTAMENRYLLKRIMERHGFRNYSKEWWHYTYKHYTGNKKYYDFVIK